MNTININSNDLSKAMQNILGVAERSASILSHVLIVSEDNTLTLTATDSQVQLTTTINLDQNIPEFRTTAPAKKLYDLIKSLDNKDLTIEFSNDGIRVTSPTGKFELHPLAPNEFPLFENTAEETSFVVKQNSFRTLF